MKNLLTLLCIFVFISTIQTLSAQNSADVSEAIPSNYLERNPIYDYSESQLNNTDSIPDFELKQDKLKITGTIFQSDGITPAKDVILYISQPDEDGDYELKTNNDKRYVHHRGWVKTDADGRYTFYTFVPGNFIQYRELKHIHPVIKEPGKQEYAMDAFLFDNDPFLSKSCRKRLAKKGIDSILVLEKKETMYVTTKDIILVHNTVELIK
jgi:protocatechuate 3,4-dioxygenase beta subunit